MTRVFVDYDKFATPTFADVPRAIPAPDPFNAAPEEAQFGEAMQAKREELRADGVTCDEIEPILQLWAKDALAVEDHRPDPDMPSGKGWRFQPRDPETGRFVKKPENDDAE